MSNVGWASFVIGLLGGFGLSVIFFSVALSSIEHKMVSKKAAIQAGVAEWQIDKLTGERRFVFLSQEDEDGDKSLGHLGVIE